MKLTHYINHPGIIIGIIIFPFISGCSSIAEDIVTKQAYDHSDEKSTGMREWEYKQKLKRDQEQREKEQGQFNEMRTQ